MLDRKFLHFELLHFFKRFQTGDIIKEFHKLCPATRHKGLQGREDIIPFILNPGPRWRFLMLQHPPKNYCRVENRE